MWLTEFCQFPQFVTLSFVNFVNPLHCQVSSVSSVSVISLMEDILSSIEFRQFRQAITLTSFTNSSISSKVTLPSFVNFKAVLCCRGTFVKFDICKLLQYQAPSWALLNLVMCFKLLSVEASYMLFTPRNLKRRIEHFISKSIFRMWSPLLQVVAWSADR